MGQQKVSAKSNEKTAIPALLQSLDLTGSLVSIDAIACEPANAELIVERQGHYLLALKKNQASLFEQVQQRMQQTKNQLASDEQFDFGSAGPPVWAYRNAPVLCRDQLESIPRLARLVTLQEHRHGGSGSADSGPAQ